MSVTQTRLLLIMVMTTLVTGRALAAEGNVDLPRFPAISPDGTEITFSWRGDLWNVPATGGLAVRLTSHPQDELSSAWSRDGSRIAFTSDRDGYQNLFIMNADGTDIRQLTVLDRSLNLRGFGVDRQGREVLAFDAVIEGDIYRSARPYLVSTDGGELIRLHDAFGSEPAISPDGSRIAFTRGGYYYGWSRRHYRGSEAMDVWIYDREDDTFTPLTEWAGNDGKSRWGGDRTLLFLSDRELRTVNLYRMSADEGDETLARLTDFDGRDVQDFDVSADGSTAALLVWDTLYTLDLDDPNAEPVALTITAVEDVRDNFELMSINRETSEAALSPDGQVLATITYGRVYVRNIEEKSPTRRITNSHARCSGVAWSPDGVKLYFASDEDGTQSIYAATVNMTRAELKKSYEEALNPPSDEAEEGAANEGAPADDAGGAAGDDEPAPDAANGADDAGEEEKDGEKELPKELDPERWHDAMTFSITPVVQTAGNDRRPMPSPDGWHLAFQRGRADLIVLDLAEQSERTLVSGWDPWMEWRWSPDSRHIAYAQNDLNFNTDIFIIPTDGSGEAVNVTRHPNNESNPRWSADGRILAFTSNRINRESDVWMVYLDKSLESLTPKELAAYYDEAAKNAKKRKPLDSHNGPNGNGPNDDDDDAGDDEGQNGGEDEDGDDEEPNLEAEEEPVEWSLDDAYLRLRRVTSMSGGESSLELTPAGDRYIFNATVDNRGLYSVKWDGSEQKRLTGPVDTQHVTLTGDKVVYVSGGRAGTVSPDGGRAETIDLDDTLRIDLQAQSSQKFLEAARVLGEGFYHHEMKGLDWDALTEEYHALARQTRTADEFNHVANRFLGELNASHLGIRARGDSSDLRQSSGRLGTTHHRVTLPDGRGGFSITKIVPESPAATSATPLEVGDVITAVNLEPFDPTDTLEAALQGLIGEEVIVSIVRTREDGTTVDLQALITPISYGREYDLKYEAWVKANQALVDELSDGGVGYIHIQGMNQSSLDVYERDLYAAAGGKDGLLIDVRNNGGGWTADRLLASIMVQPHAYTIPRGAPLEATGHYPQDRLFIQRYTLPVNMLCNEKSFSNAEIVSHAFKTLKRGTLVGQETYGGVISTGGHRLIDGTFVRMPFRGWYLLDGTDMEDRGAVPDLLVPQTPEAESRNEDEQLRAAVEDILKRID